MNLATAQIAARCHLSAPHKIARHLFGAFPFLGLFPRRWFLPDGAARAGKACPLARPGGCRPRRRLARASCLEVRFPAATVAAAAFLRPFAEVSTAPEGPSASAATGLRARRIASTANTPRKPATMGHFKTSRRPVPLQWARWLRDCSPAGVAALRRRIGVRVIGAWRRRRTRDVDGEHGDLDISSPAVNIMPCSCPPGWDPSPLICTVGGATTTSRAPDNGRQSHRGRISRVRQIIRGTHAVIAGPECMIHAVTIFSAIIGRFTTDMPDGPCAATCFKAPFSGTAKSNFPSGRK